MGIEILQEGLALASGQFPRFVYSPGRGRSSAQYLPIFAFHSLEPDDFERKLRYLKENGYRTICLDEAVRWMSANKALPERAIVLTIDDGRLSTWSVGYPLLRKYGLQATAFVIVNYIEEGPPRPTIDPEAPGSESSKEVVLPERVDRQTVLRWSEVHALHDSGVVAIESHTALHKQIVVSPRIAGFVTPDFSAPWYEIPRPASSREGWTGSRRGETLGLPLYAAAPVLTLERGLEASLLDDHPCAGIVQDRGGRAFFDDPDWERILTIEARRLEGVGGEIDLRAEQDWEIRHSKEVLEERLANKRVTHLCFPRGSGSDRAAELARQVGYASCLWAFRPSRVSNRPGCDPYAIGRIKHDWIERLPGTGRVSVARIGWRKLSRRAVGETGF